MIPQQEVVYSDDLEIVTMPSLTFKINYENNRIEGMIDEIEAMKQAIDIILETTRYAEEIFPDWFGNELNTLIGLDRFYVESEAERMIKDALLTDDRILEIKDFIILDGEEGDAIIVKFTAVTIFGKIDIEKVVAI